MIGKVAPAFRSILTNSDGPLMDLFGQFVDNAPAPLDAPGPGHPASARWPRPMARPPTPQPLPANPFQTAEAHR